MPSFQKQKRETDKKYLEYIKTLPCAVCFKNAEPHHTKSRGAGGSDYYTISLCREHHTEVHMLGKTGFEDKYCIDIDGLIIKCLIGYVKLIKGG